MNALWSQFRRSRVGVRVLAMFLLAAAVPIVLLTVLAQRAIDEALLERQSTVLANTAKSAGILAMDRLQLAAQLLHTATVEPMAAASQDPSSRPLLAWVDVAADGRRTVRFGDEMAKPLLHLPLPAFAAGLDTSIGLARGIAAATDHVVVAHQDGAAGAVRLGLVSPDFLWADAGKLPPGLVLCALGHTGHTLYCSETGLGFTAERWAQGDAGVSSFDGAGSRRAVWPLFMRASFGVPDWRFVVTNAGAVPGQGVLASVLPAVAVASLLLATLLSLVQIRRTLTPLSRLAAAARQIAARRFDTRVYVRSGDEFGQMANAFNEMAGELQAQFDELQALAEIDKAIVDHCELDAILAQVADRLAAIDAGCTVLIGRFRVGGTAPASCLVRRAGHPSVERRPLDIDRAALMQWFGEVAEHRLDEVRSLPLDSHALGLDHGLQALSMSLSAHGVCLGFLAVVAPGPMDWAESRRRQLLELRNRATVALSAANREDRLVHEARHDSLTGLLNRAGLLEALRDVAGHSTPSSPMAVLFIDVDRFKAVNDAHGHAVGDQVLRDIAVRLARRLPLGAMLARPGGDEFIAVLGKAHAADAVARLAQTICMDLSLVAVANIGPVSLGASIGIAFHDDAQRPVDEVLRHADQAMYEAKRRGKGRHAFFEPELDVAAQRHALIERELPLAVERNELRLVYQPRFDLHDRRIHSAEALVRWHHPTRGLCLPSEFIPVAEDSDLIERVGQWVIEAACKQVKAWRKAGIAELRVAVNLSARQLKCDRLETDLSQTMARHGVTPADLELEITESVFVGDAEDVGERLQRLRALGLSIALDDFGTGYSSMSYLRKLPVDVLKIDRSFVMDMDSDPAALAVARAIVALASSLKLRTVAEGVETEAQLALLSSLGCDEVQGYYFSRPVAPAALVRLLEQQAREAAVCVA